jgi:hypothetical protein
MNLVQKIKFLATRIYNSFIMISEDNIATAQIAQLFGSELLRVQEGARTDSGSQPNILNIDPKQFLVPDQTAHFRAAKKADEERIVRMLQQEAEAAYPAAPVEHQPASTVPPIPQPVQQASQHNPSQTVSAIGSGDALERIASSLERIAIRLEGVDLSVKKRKIKRTIK